MQYRLHGAAGQNERARLPHDVRHVLQRVEQYILESGGGHLSIPTSLLPGRRGRCGRRAPGLRGRGRGRRGGPGPRRHRRGPSAHEAAVAVCVRERTQQLDQQLQRATRQRATGRRRRVLVGWLRAGAVSAVVLLLGGDGGRRRRRLRAARGSVGGGRGSSLLQCSGNGRFGFLRLLCDRTGRGFRSVQ